MIGWFRRHQRAKQKRVVATATYRSALTLMGKKTGEEHAHIVAFIEDGNGKRSTSTDSTNGGRIYEDRHQDLFKARLYWVNHGILPDHAVRTDGPPRKAELIVFPGGAA